MERINKIKTPKKSFGQIWLKVNYERTRFN